MARDHFLDDFMPPCMERGRRREPAGCECTEDPAVRDYRKLLCHFLDSSVVIISDNFFSIVCGVVDRVTQGTVELIEATVFGVPVPKVSVTLTKINVIVPLPPGASCDEVVAGIRANARLNVPLP